MKIVSNWVISKTEEDFQMNRMGRISNRQSWTLWSSVAITFSFYLFIIIRIMLLSQDFDENADKLLVFFIAILIIIYISIFNDRTHISVLLNSKVKAEEGVVDTDTYSQGKAKFHYLLIDDRKFLLSEKVYVGIKEGLLARIYYLKDDIFLGIEYLEKLA